MNEIRSRVITYAAAPERQRRVPKLQGRRTGKTDIDRFGLHVKTILRYADGVRPEIFIAFWSSVSADDVNLGIGTANGSGCIRKNIKNPRIIVMHLSRAGIAQEMVKLR